MAYELYPAASLVFDQHRQVIRQIGNDPQSFLIEAALTPYSEDEQVAIESHALACSQVVADQRQNPSLDLRQLEKAAFDGTRTAVLTCREANLSPDAYGRVISGMLPSLSRTAIHGAQARSRLTAWSHDIRKTLDAHPELRAIDNTLAVRFSSIDFEYVDAACLSFGTFACQFAHQVGRTLNRMPTIESKAQRIMKTADWDEIDRWRAEN